MKKKVSFRAWIFPKLLTPKNGVTWMSDGSCFRTPFSSQCVHAFQTLLKLARQHFLPNFPLMLEKLRWKKPLLLGYEILRVCFTGWRPITCLLVKIERNSCKTFKRNYLQKNKLFPNFLLNFRNLNKISRILKKRSAS